MKYSILLFIAVFAFSQSSCTAQDSKTEASKSGKAQINWMTMEEAQAAQKKEPRKLMVDVYTKWCGPCKMMMSNTFSHPKIIEFINENYYAVKFNAEGAEEVTYKGKVYTNPSYNEAKKNSRNGTHQLTGVIAPVNGRIAYPTIVYFDENLEVIQAVQGYLKPPQIEPILKYFATDSHKTIPWPDYQKGFQSDI
ncbi:MAG: thioredoxin fold domain-containing protein [Bacteroidia bacterium]|nr:thioredoxin fold domain-containing protein [Bacteroidia bacterium]